ncbi:Serpentine Receptor, class T [Aphelenchoides bicaudatus]|nr:Serpentine Receptor, class T [Aphelenchoides bicaudatus]
MDILLRRRDVYQRLYNCSFYSVDSIPIEERQHKAYGWMLVAMFIVFELLYAPCVFAMAQKKLRQNFCYKLMLIMATFDMLLMPTNILQPGYANINGYVYCSFPLLSYFNGIALFCLWIGYATCAVILAFNRCLLYSNYNWIFEGEKEYFWLALPFITLTYTLIFGRAGTYSVVSGTLFFNPHVDFFPDDDDKYYSYIQFVINTCFSFLVPGVYAIYFINNYKLAQNRPKGMSKSEYSLFFQLLGINITIGSAAMFFVLIQFIEVPKFLMFYPHISWVLISGAPPITFNKSIQRVLVKKIGLSKIVPSDTHQQQTPANSLAK